ncbi:MAG TPA: TIGR00730 family Rossman fold protein [Prosthecobacter sp.]|nr:TIGR00730 family Rossman fold protein [Prosthecobacter sp.]
MRIAIYCGANSGASPIYREAAATVARHLAEQGIGIVYGGGKVGLMGAVADAALAAGGEVIGVIPQSLMDKELAHAGATQLHVVKSMHERKQLMTDLCDGVIALPGGFGTLDELFEALTWLQLGFHAKPIGLLNVAGFFDGLLHFITTAREAGFLRQEHEACVLVATDPAALLTQMRTFHPPDLGKWIEEMAAAER